VCGLLVLIGRRSARHLVYVSLSLAGGSLFLLDFYSLRRIDSDRSTRQFFASVERRLSPADRLYSYELNEDVLGRAFLGRPGRIISLRDPNPLAQQLSRRGAYLLAEPKWVDRRRTLAAGLDPVERGRAGPRPMALYRSRGDGIGAISTDSNSRLPAVAVA